MRSAYYHPVALTLQQASCCLLTIIWSAYYLSCLNLPLRIEEDHKKPIYCVTFNQVDEGHSDIFASVGGNRVSKGVYGSRSGGFGRVKEGCRQNCELALQQGYSNASKLEYRDVDRSVR